MNPRHLLLAVLYILELQHDIEKLNERVAEQDKTIKDLEKYKEWYYDPHEVRKIFDRWCESGVYPNAYGYDGVLTEQKENIA